MCDGMTGWMPMRTLTGSPDERRTDVEQTWELYLTGQLWLGWQGERPHSDPTATGTRHLTLTARLNGEDP